MAPLLLRAALPRWTCEAWLGAVAAAGTVSRALSSLPGLDTDAVLQTIADSALRRPLEQALGAAPWCNIDQSWLRHGRPPHRWHQDGALGLDFAAHAGRPLPVDALLDLRVVWIALTPCGAFAPGIEWVDTPLEHLLQPAELSDEAVTARFSAPALRRPVLHAGDALVFDGRMLHRTHLSVSMQLPRTSLELRFCRAGHVPARLGRDRWLALPTAADPAAPGKPP